MGLAQPLHFDRPLEAGSMTWGTGIRIAEGGRSWFAKSEAIDCPPGQEGWTRHQKKSRSLR